MKYHINPEAGNPKQCTAKIKCRFGEDTPHFDTKEEARDYLVHFLIAKC